MFAIVRSVSIRFAILDFLIVRDSDSWFRFVLQRNLGFFSCTDASVVGIQSRTHFVSRDGASPILALARVNMIIMS